MNPAQVACIELRRAAYLNLRHGEMLELLGARPSGRRRMLFNKVAGDMPERARNFWQDLPGWLETGAIGVGRFEGYFRLFRRRALPFAHTRRRVRDLLEPRSPDERERFYEQVWNNRRWRGIFQVFFSRFVMGRLGRDPEFFRYVEGSVADRILERTRHALVELEPAANPYLWWILTGGFGEALPEALREDRFESIADALREGRFECFEGSLEQWLEEGRKADAFNLSDIFEYMSEANCGRLMEGIAAASTPGTRWAYWNMLAPRSSPASLRDRVRPLDDLAEELFRRDQAFFYSRFIVEEVAS
jgi:S-adenosylmethionine-diacylglycerol 3-amino-3-carboxypropyl transferase